MGLGELFVLVAIVVYYPIRYRFNRYLWMVVIWGLGYPIGLFFRENLIGDRPLRFYLADTCFVAAFVSFTLAVVSFMHRDHPSITTRTIANSAQIHAVVATILAVTHELFQFYLGKGDWLDLFLFTFTLPIVLLALQGAKQPKYGSIHFGRFV